MVKGAQCLIFPYLQNTMCFYLDSSFEQPYPKKKRRRVCTSNIILETINGLARATHTQLIESSLGSFNIIMYKICITKLKARIILSPLKALKSLE